LDSSVCFIIYDGAQAGGGGGAGRLPIGIAIEELGLIWSASEAEEWLDRLVWIPL